MRINEIRLLTNQLDCLQHFYRDVLKLTISSSSEQHISFTVGASMLTFVKTTEIQKPYYHFAFNITCSKFMQALEWLKQRNVAINTIDGEKFIYSKSWNSHSVYFYDTAGNIVEFIARYNLSHQKDSTQFSSSDILNISEIGLASEDVLVLSKYLQGKYALEIFLDGNSIFIPIGNEEGLFILSSRNRNWLGSNKAVDIFPLEIVIKHEHISSERLLDYPYTITTIK